MDSEEVDITYRRYLKELKMEKDITRQQKEVFS
jgi:hypothetical protein